MYDEIIRRTFNAFQAELEARPQMKLRGGAAVDGYDHSPAYDPVLDEPTDSCLDAVYWRHYIPRLIDYALRHIHNGASRVMVIHGLLGSLRPPEQNPPRLGSLTPAQKAVIVAFLDEAAFSDDSAYQDLVMQAASSQHLKRRRIHEIIYKPLNPLKMDEVLGKSLLRTGSKITHPND
jgi:hypothetical protein